MHSQPINLYHCLHMHPLLEHVVTRIWCRWSLSYMGNQARYAGYAGSILSCWRTYFWFFAQNHVSNFVWVTRPQSAVLCFLAPEANGCVIGMRDSRIHCIYTYRQWVSKRVKPYYLFVTPKYSHYIYTTFLNLYVENNEYITWTDLSLLTNSLIRF